MTDHDRDYCAIWCPDILISGTIWKKMALALVGSDAGTRWVGSVGIRYVACFGFHSTLPSVSPG